MQSLKILITLVVLITLGIIVGSNLIPTMTVTLLNQPTITLPVGLWLAIAIGLGLSSSSIFQFLIFLERRLLDRKIRQLQSRLKQDEDIFTYTSAPPKVDREPVGGSYRNEERVSRPATEPSEPPVPKKSIFSSYRANFADTFKSKPAHKRIIVDDEDDDWNAAPVSNRQLEWDEPPPQPRQQKANFTSDNYTAPRSPTFDRDAEPVRRDEEVYDAEFRLIQPPYKEPADRSDYLEPEENEDDVDLERENYSDVTPPSAKTSSTKRDRVPKHAADNEDWGFDFDEEDPPSQQPKSPNRR